MTEEPPVAFERTLESHLRRETQEMTEERVVATMSVDDQPVLQPMGIVHGGVYATMAEGMVSEATFRVVYPDGNIAVGMSNSTSFLRPISKGTIHAEAHRRHRGRTTWIWDVDFTDDDGRLCATTRVTIAVRPIPASG
ncbi:MAG: PaaI family thioesterase [Thermoleophilaceae bacterium]